MYFQYFWVVACLIMVRPYAKIFVPRVTGSQAALGYDQQARNQYWTLQISLSGDTHLRAIYDSAYPTRRPSWCAVYCTLELPFCPTWMNRILQHCLSSFLLCKFLYCKEAPTKSIMVYLSVLHGNISNITLHSVPAAWKENWALLNMDLFKTC